ncbi:unnamed protein product [Rhizoctonia solani]|uniref:Laminin domain protein n=1 Tax=Rhizoctonia solani TaxID=456999 RepID=A0A8H3DKG3_9AGAM|nr:unnamed protein product [Rhizoctonia solani]
MADHPGWYPPGQVCYPPNLPTYLKNVYDLKPIVGVPSDDEVIGIHVVMQAANRASGTKYRSKYSLVVYPSDAAYTPPTLPAHIAITLEPVSGAPSEGDLIKVQDAIRAYQQFSLAPSMFDAHVNMELSHHLFNLQMARYIRCAGERRPSPVPAPQEIPRQSSPVQSVEQILDNTEELTITTNNAGTGANAVAPPLAPSDMRESERPTQPTGQLHPLTECFNQVLERLTQLLEKVHQPVD